MKLLLIRLLALSLILSGCSGNDPLESAKKMEKLGRFPSAIYEYERIIQENPQAPHTPEALYRTGEIYRKTIRDYEKAGIKIVQGESEAASLMTAQPALAANAY